MPEVKRKVIDLAWALGLRRLADRVQQRYLAMRNLFDNRRFRAEHPEFTLPPAALVFDANHNLCWRTYHESGQASAERIATVAREYLGEKPAEHLAVLEWGCGPGRIIRHLGAALPSTWDVSMHGADFNEASIAWCRDHLPGISFTANGLLPPLPLAADTFDFVYAVSVITHLSEQSIDQWMAEMRRLLKTGGYFMLTSHGDSFLARVPEEMRAAYAAGRVVSRTADAEGSKLFATYHPEGWLKTCVERHRFEVVRHWPEPQSGLGQDIWVLRALSAGPE